MNASSSTPLSEQELENIAATLPGWSYSDGKLSREFSFNSFKEAMSFMVRVAFEAESLDHHPEWSNVYSSVSIKLCTHDAGDKVTGQDVELARRINHVSWI